MNKKNVSSLHLPRFLNARCLIRHVIEKREHPELLEVSETPRRLDTPCFRRNLSSLLPSYVPYLREFRQVCGCYGDGFRGSSDSFVSFGTELRSPNVLAANKTFGLRGLPMRIVLHGNGHTGRWFMRLGLHGCGFGCGEDRVGAMARGSSTLANLGKWVFRCQT